MAVSGKERYRALVALADDAIPLTEAAAALACIETPEADPSEAVARIEALALQARALSGDEAGDLERLEAVNDVLFREAGLAGAEADYYDPRSSFLSDVLDRRRGIPIALSVIFLGVARRVGLRAEGVGFPGHFLVRCVAGGQALLLDPFYKGRIVSRPELAERLRAATGSDELRPEHTRAATRREILTRMLNNLRAVYLRRRNWMTAAEVLEWLVVTNPDKPDLLRDRAVLYRRLECFSAAIADLRAYAAARPNAPDAPAVRALIADLESRSVTVH